MVCPSCGSENPSTNRFCGMCGTPLPHRPLTTPGAQSTLSFTRVPIEVTPAPLVTVLPQTIAIAAKTISPEKKIEPERVSVPQTPVPDEAQDLVAVETPASTAEEEEEKTKIEPEPVRVPVTHVAEVTNADAADRQREVDCDTIG